MRKAFLQRKVRRPKQFKRQQDRFKLTPCSSEKMKSMPLDDTSQLSTGVLGKKKKTVMGNSQILEATGCKGSISQIRPGNWQGQS